MATELMSKQPAQPAQNAQTSAPVYGGATGAVNKTVDSVVTNIAKTEDSNVGEDKEHRAAAQSEAAQKRQANSIPRLEMMTDPNLKTVVSFDVDDADRVYIIVQDVNTGDEIVQIPSKEFEHFLNQRFEELFGNTDDEYQKGISQSI